MKNEEELSEFLKFAYEHNRVRNIDEAFEEFPVEEEWHKGKVENVLREESDNVLREESDNYNSYKIGDIVFVKRYNYPDGKEGKNHFFVIIDQNNIAVPIENFGMLISSNLDKLKYKANIPLEKNETNGLKKDSLVKTDVVYKILNNQIVFRIGKVDSDKIDEYKNSFYDINMED